LKNGRYEETGCICWYLNGFIHRDDDLPAVEWEDGAKAWYQHGAYHRDNDLPSYIGGIGYKVWHQHGERHRTTGPAVITSVGEQHWYLNDKLLYCNTQEEFEKLMKLKAFW
jgi:hypothetical protein